MKTENLTLYVLLIISIVAMFLMGADSKEIVMAIGGGIVGYLTKTNEGEPK